MHYKTTSWTFNFSCWMGGFQEQFTQQQRPKQRICYYCLGKDRFGAEEQIAAPEVAVNNSAAAESSQIWQQL